MSKLYIMLNCEQSINFLLVNEYIKIKLSDYIIKNILRALARILFS